jgi:hypothetical protein
MAEYINETISTIIDKVNHNAFLPDIQRPYVWKELDVYKLFDSLMRKYPIGTFLIWVLDKRTIEEIEQKDFKIEMYEIVDDNGIKENKKINSRDRDEYWLILDGQQRLTTLNIALKGVWRDKSEEKELYFNALSGDVENDDNLQYEFCFYSKKKGVVFVDVDVPKKMDKLDFGKIVSSIDPGEEKALVERIYTLANDTYNRKKRLGKTEKEKIKQIFKSLNFGVKAWVNVKNVFESDISRSKEKEEYFGKILPMEENVDFQKIKDNINDLHNTMREKVINYHPIKESEYDRVLDIFVRTNSGGVKLGYSDLLFSRIKLNWGDAREEFNKLIKKINGGNYDFDNDFILKSCLVALSQKSDDVKYSVNNFSIEKINSIKTNWEKIKESCEFTIDLLDRFLINSPKFITSKNALIPIVYWKYMNEKKSVSHDREENQYADIRTWFIKVLLSGVFGGQSDNMLYKCKQEIDENRGAFPATKIESVIESANKSMELKESIIDTYGYNTLDSYLFLSLVYKKAISFKPNYKRNIPEQDHIFCKKELGLAGVPPEKINSIYNIRYVTQYDNRTKSDDSFDEWVKKLGNEKANVFETHLIPDEKWKIEDFDKFLAERKKKFLDRLKYDGLIAGGETESEVDEEDPS